MLRRASSVVGILIVLSMLVPATRAHTQVDPEVQKLMDTYAAAWAKGDAKALASLYAEQGVRAGSDGQLYRGRNEIEQGFVKLFAGPFKGAKITIRAEHDQMITKDAVRITTGTYEVSGVSNPAPGAAMKGRFVNTSVRQDGRWVLASTTAIGMH